MAFSTEPHWQLRVLDDSGAEVSIPMDSVPKCVGRGEEQVDIRLLSAQVSRRHADFRVEADGSLVVRDLKSTNGVEVNGQRIEGERALVEGDVVRIARWQFTAADLRPTQAAAEPETTVSSADSIAALDFMLDSQGNLRHDQLSLKAPQPMTEAPQKPVEAAAATEVTRPAVRAQVRPVPVETSPAEETLLAAADSSINLSSVGDFVDSQAGKLLFGGSQFGIPALGLDDSCPGTAPQPAARACDLHLVGEGRAPGVSAADLCAVQTFAERQLVVPNPAKRRQLLCEFTTGPVFRRNVAAVLVATEGKIEISCGALSSLPGAGLHVEKTLVRRAAQEKRAIVAWDAHFEGGASAVAVCCPLTGGEFLYAVTTFENATPAWMSLVAQTAFMDRLVRKSWTAIDKIRKPAALPMGAAA